MKLGCHVNNNGKDMLVGSIKEALSYNANCFMVYLGAPQNTYRKPLVDLKYHEMKKIADEVNISLEDVIVHAPYIVNLARSDEEKHEFAVNFLTQELRGLSVVGCKYIVLHPGSAVDSSREEAIKQIACGINKILDNTSCDNTVIVLETMAGKGNEIGRTFEEIASIISYVKDQNRIGVCLDTCHVNDAGYDLVNNYDEVFNMFDNIIGFKYLKVIHVNDSKNVLSSHKDRHENIGFGNIGFEPLLKVITDKRFEHVCKILETPYVISDDKKSNYPPYKYEIEMIKSGRFNPQLLDQIKESK